MAVAGAVENNRCPMTNITWVIDGKQLQQQFKFQTAVLNDFEAVGYGIPALDSKDLVVLNDVAPLPRAPKVVMGPGVLCPGSCSDTQCSAATAPQISPCQPNMVFCVR